MDIKIWEGGLQPQEIIAIDKIKVAFSKQGKMFPWKGYAGFRFTNSKGKEGEFDLVIVTHCNVIIVELKDWNHQPITCVNGRWYKGDRDMGTSPVTVTKNKVFTLQNKLEKYRNKFTNKGRVPFIKYMVVMTGDADFSQLQGVDKDLTISLDDFLKLANASEFNNKFPTNHPLQRTVNQDFDIFDELFLGNQTKARSLNVGGYTAEDVIFDHPKGIYKEYYAVTKGEFKNEALLRWWDFSKVSGVKGSTPNGRGQIVSRERNVLQYLKNHNQELYNHCLRSLTPFDPDEVTTISAELFEFPSNHFRFNEFIGKYASLYSEADLLVIAKILLAQFVSLHKVQVAHRDINTHSLWLSQSKTVVISNLACAYFKPVGTVGDYREQLAVGAIEAIGDDSENQKFNTPFESDVYALAIMLWHLLSGQRISQDTLLSLQSDLKKSFAFYAPVIYDAIFNKAFKDALEFLTAFQAAEPKRAEVLTFDAKLLEPYRHSINHSRQFRPSDEIDFFVETDEKEVYCSNGFIVKAWLNTGGINASDIEAFQIHKFIKKIEKLKSINSPYIPRIEEFGIAQKSSSLFLVTEYITDSKSWRQKYNQCSNETVEISHDERLADIGKLIAAIEELHELHIAHGDLHDENILFDTNIGQIYLIDIPDFNLSGDESRNTQYALERYDTDAYQRDNYAVMKLASEILGFSFGEGSEIYPTLAEAIQNELEDEEFGFKGIARFKQAFDNLGDKSKQIITVYDDRVQEDFTIYPENMQMYVGITTRTEGPDPIASLTFNGIGGSYTLQYDLTRSSKKIFGGYAPRKKDYLSEKEKENSQTSLNIEIQIKASDHRNHVELANYLMMQDDFIEIVESSLQDHIAIQEQAHLQKTQQAVSGEEIDVTQTLSNSIDSVQSIQPIVVSSYAIENEQHDKSSISTSNKFNTHKLWTAILDAEIDAAPSIELKETASVRGDTFVCPYDAVKDPLESFDDSDTDKVYAFITKIDYKALKTEGKRPEQVEFNDELAKEFIKEFKIGEVDLKASSLHEVHITKVKNTRYPPEEGDIIYFRSMQSNASLRKRKHAIERILNKQSVISNLADLFDPKCNTQANDYDIQITDTDFARYDRIDDHGNQISLNSQQREAFQKLINSGPLSLLQGPPGTGKTEFIAAFVHYLIEKQNVKNILLVSQSHEAVNNAAERIRKHCARLQTPLEVVRFSNRDTTVSDGLKDVFSKAITTEKRELFLAELKTRISSLATALGLQSDVMVKVVELELQLFKQIDDLLRLKKIFKNIIEHEHSKTSKENMDFDLDAQIKELEASIRWESLNEFNVDISSKTPIDFQLKNRIIKALSIRFGLNTQETQRVSALAKVTKEMIDTLSGDYVNYDEFYARSRQLVIGTCVGIGQGHLNIRENIYDWVIIDEAARSQSGELAIAMQSGKRVLLVGDHHQLPPNYLREQKKVIARKLGIQLGSGNYDEIDDLLKSDFDRAFNSEYGQQVSESLWMQYRMATPIGELVSKIFYGGNLESSGRLISKQYNQSADVLYSTVTWVDTSDKGRDAYHTEVDHRGKIHNKEEAKAIITILKQIAKDEDLICYLNSVRKSDAAIGVICMYAEQKRYLHQLFNQNAWPEGFKYLVNIDTVDSYQGKENRIIIVSITRSDKSNSYGFMDMPNRINVALSRAMDRLIIVGNKNVWCELNKDLPFGKVIKYMEDQGEDKGYRFLLSQSLKGEMI